MRLCDMRLSIETLSLIEVRRGSRLTMDMLKIPVRATSTLHSLSECQWVNTCVHCRVNLWDWFGHLDESLPCMIYIYIYIYICGVYYYVRTEVAIYTVLYYTILYYTILHCSILFYTGLYYTILHYTILYYTTLHYTILYYTILYYTILYYTILYYTILYYTCLLYTSPSPRDGLLSRMPSSA